MPQTAAAPLHFERLSPTPYTPLRLETTRFSRFSWGGEVGKVFASTSTTVEIFLQPIHAISNLDDYNAICENTRHRCSPRRCELCCHCGDRSRSRRRKLQRYWFRSWSRLWDKTERRRTHILEVSDWLAQWYTRAPITVIFLPCTSLPPCHSTILIASHLQSKTS